MPPRRSPGIQVAGPWRWAGPTARSSCERSSPQLDRRRMPSPVRANRRLTEGVTYLAVTGARLGDTDTHLGFTVGPPQGEGWVGLDEVVAAGLVDRMAAALRAREGPLRRHWRPARWDRRWLPGHGQAQPARPHPREERPGGQRLTRPSYLERFSLLSLG